MNNFDALITRDIVATYSGMVMITILVTQFCKELGFLKGLKTKYVASGVALSAVLMGSFYSGNFSFSDIYLYLVNAILITFAATGGYDFSQKKQK